MHTLFSPLKKQHPYNQLCKKINIMLNIDCDFDLFAGNIMTLKQYV